MPHKTLSRASALLQVVFALLLFALAGGAVAAGQPRRILFIGNSLTYVNNLPAATASLAPPEVEVDAFALPGAALSDDVGNPRVAELLTHGHYTDVVFQERGGEVVCNSEACMDSAAFKATEHASVVLANMARHGGARVYYLGTWQLNPAVEPLLVRGERRTAEAMGARYIEIGETWVSLRRKDSQAAWLHTDGQHPGYATTALMAVRIWHAISGERPTRAPCVGGPLYYHAPSEDGFFKVDRKAKPITCLVSPAQATAFPL